VVMMFVHLIRQGDGNHYAQYPLHYLPSRQ
jgi:hypothetical protein